MAQSKPKTNKQTKRGLCARDFKYFNTHIDPLHQFPKLKPAEPNFFFPFKFGGKTFLPSQDHMCQFSAQKEFLDAGERGWELKIYSRSAISEVSEPGWQGTVTQAGFLLQPQLKPALGGLPQVRETERGLSGFGTAPFREVHRLVQSWRHVCHPMVFSTHSQTLVGTRLTSWLSPWLIWHPRWIHP